MIKLFETKKKRLNKVQSYIGENVFNYKERLNDLITPLTRSNGLIMPEVYVCTHFGQGETEFVEYRVKATNEGVTNPVTRIQTITIYFNESVITDTICASVMPKDRDEMTICMVDILIETVYQMSMLIMSDTSKIDTVFKMKDKIVKDIPSTSKHADYIKQLIIEKI